MTTLTFDANIEPVVNPGNPDIHWLQQAITDGGCDHSVPALCGEEPIHLWDCEIAFPAPVADWCLGCLQILGALAEAEDAPAFVVRVGAA